MKLIINVQTRRTLLVEFTRVMLYNTGHIQQYLLSKPATRQTLTNTSHVTQRNDVIKHTYADVLTQLSFGLGPRRFAETQNHDGLHDHLDLRRRPPVRLDLTNVFLIQRL